MKCKICESDDTKIIQKEVRHKKEQVDCNVWKCNNCGLAFIEDDNTQEKLDEYFKTDFWTNLFGADNPEEHFTERRVIQANRYDNKVKGYFKKTDDVLEIGCAAGAFLDVIRNDVKSVEGVELSAPFAEFAKKKLGIEVKNIPVNKLPGKPAYDVICMFHILQHVSNPVDFMKEVHKRLRPGGTVILENQNITDPLLSVFDVDEYRKFYFVKTNIFYFSENAMKTVLEKSGFRDVEFRSYQHYSITNNLHWVFTGKTITKNKTLGSEAIVPGLKDDNIKPLLGKMNQDYKDYLKANGLTDTILCIAKK